jgi:hypothetical protein
LRAFNLFHHHHSPALRRQYFRGWFFFPVVWLIFCVTIWYLADRPRGTPWRTFLDLKPLFSGVPLWLIYFPFAYRWKLRKILAAMVKEGENRSLFTRHRIEISPEAITESTQFETTSTSWKAIERVANNEAYVFIYKNALGAFIVPRRAFATPSEFEQFINLARGYQTK